jgi:hypothetical protein
MYEKGGAFLVTDKKIPCEEWQKDHRIEEAEDIILLIATERGGPEQPPRAAKETPWPEPEKRARSHAMRKG